MEAYRISTADRALFKECRRAWDLGAETRRGLEPLNSPTERGLGGSTPSPSITPSVDAFIPIEVAADIEVNIPDPVLSDRSLATTVGQPVRFVTHLDGFVHGPFVDPDLLALDQVALADCWAWQEFSLDSRMAGVIFNEVRLDSDDGFRRTAVPGRSWPEAFDMLDAGLALYPNPSPEHCGSCTFRAPCRTIQEGRDAGPILATAYRRRPDRPLEEGRLGGRSWRMSRGARPPHFGLSGDRVDHLHDP